MRIRLVSIWRVAAWLAGLTLLAGCARVPLSEQGRVAKPNMVFADTAAFNEKSALQCQIEPGTAASGGAQAAGFTSCK